MGQQCVRAVLLLEGYGGADDLHPYSFSFLGEGLAISSQGLGNLDTEHWGVCSKLEKRKAQKQMSLLWSGLGKAGRGAWNPAGSGGRGEVQGSPQERWEDQW